MHVQACARERGWPQRSGEGDRSHVAGDHHSTPPYVHTHTQFVPLNTDSDVDGYSVPSEHCFLTLTLVLFFNIPLFSLP